MMGPLIIPLMSGGGELRLVFGEGGCDLQSWHRFHDGRAMMAGGLRLSLADLRVLEHAVKYARWTLEHPRSGLLERDQEAAQWPHRAATAA